MLKENRLEGYIKTLKKLRRENYLFAVGEAALTTFCAPYTIHQIQGREPEMAILGGVGTLVGILLATRSVLKIRKDNKAIREVNQTMEYLEESKITI